MIGFDSKLPTITTLPLASALTAQGRASIEVGTLLLGTSDLIAAVSLPGNTI